MIAGFASSLDLIGFFLCFLKVFFYSFTIQHRICELIQMDSGFFFELFFIVIFIINLFIIVFFIHII